MKTPFYKIIFTNCDSLDYGYTVVPDIKDIQMCIDQVEDDLNDPKANASIKIEMVMMTEKQYEKLLDTFEP